MDQFVYVGCRTTRERNARGDGIHVLRMEAATGRLTSLYLVGDLVNPSFLALSRDGGFLYAVHGDGSAASAFRVDTGSGQLAFLNREETAGRNPAHLALDPTGRWLLVANHYSCTLAVLPLRPNGCIGPVSDLVTMEGPVGPHRVEQPFAKPHQVEFDPSGRLLLVPDKGLDRLYAFHFDAEAGKLRPALLPFATARENAGPRHVAFHPGGAFAYVLNELDCSITAYRIDVAVGAEPFQLIPSLPDSFTGSSRAAEIMASADGRFVYASNRGHDSIGVFAVDAATGRLSPVQWVPSGGRTPRFFALAPGGRFLLAANEDSDTVVTFAIGSDGRLSRTGAELRTGSPTCLIFRPIGAA
jgi:6-phosphogluconolactonase